MACNPKRSEQIADLAAGKLHGEAVDLLLDHLGGCEPCSKEFDLAADLVSLGPAEAASPPRAKRVERAPILRMLIPLAAAAILLLSIVKREPAVALSTLANLEALPYPTSVLRGSEPDDRRDAMEHYQAGEFERAEVELAALAAADDLDGLARFYRGLALVQLERLEEAHASFDSAARVSEGLLQERALWYMANAALALNRGGSARSTLERLRDLDGEYALDATAKLDALLPLLDESER